MNVSGILANKGAEVATVTPDTPVCEALAMLRQWGVGALVVSADSVSISGLVSERDIVRYFADVGSEAFTHPVSQLMTVEVHTCRRSDNAEGLMAMMTKHRIRHVPVVDDAALLIGMISIGDVVKGRVEELERDQAQLIDYVRSGR